MDQQQKFTIQDIAELANVSISTVSRVLNNTAPVAEETRKRVLKIIADLGYQPNLFAQGLAGGQSRTIGVLTQLIGSPFYDVILRGILQGIDGSGYSPLFADGGWNAENENIEINKFIQRQVDGLILLDGHSPEADIQKIARKIPIIIVGREIPGLLSQCVPFDDFEAAYRATKFLIESGHRQIAHIAGMKEHEDAIKRRDGYLAALTDAGIPVYDELIIDGDFTEPSGVMAAEMLLMRGNLFSAIFAANDQMAYGARLALYRRGIRVPEDVSLVGFDDQAPSAYMVPPLSTIRRTPLEIGEAVGEALIQLIKGKSPQIPKFSSKLMVRESVIRRF